MRPADRQGGGRIVPRVGALCGVLAWLAVAGCQGPATTAPEHGGLRSPHRDADGFFNPWRRFDDNGLGAFLRWQLWESNPYDKSGEPRVPLVENDGAYLSGRENSASVTWVGHATFAVHDGDDVFLTDPHFGKRALLPARVFPPGLPVESIPPDAFAVISHNHYDHLDASTIDALPPSVGYYVPLGLADWFRSRDREDVTELDWWETAERGRFRITCLPSQHWSLRIGQSANSTLWCSWLVESDDLRYYFAGDTGYFPGFAEFGRTWPDIDVAMLPIGAYAPRWLMAYQHMDPAQAYQAFRDLGARYMLPMHWGTFDLTDEPLDLPPVELTRAVEQEGGDLDRVRVMAIGERWKIPGREPSSEQEEDPDESPEGG